MYVCSSQSRESSSESTSDKVSGIILREAQPSGFNLKFAFFEEVKHWDPHRENCWAEKKIKSFIK